MATILTLPEDASTTRPARYRVVLTATGPGGRQVKRIAVEVKAAAATGLTGLGYGSCALLNTDGVYCWGAGDSGQLGNGMFYGTPRGSASAVQVLGVGGVGTLSGVASLSGDKAGYICALLVSTGVDCWGFGAGGQLGNGVFYGITPGYTSSLGSATPVEVLGVGGLGTLTGVKSLASNGYANGFCALLDSGGVDCWGDNTYGELGIGTFSYGSAVPVQVEGVGGLGTLTGVTSLVNNTGGTYCAVLDSGGVDCWGAGMDGELGNGSFYSTTPHGSAIPVPVLGAGGVGTLAGVTTLASGGTDYCALLASGGVDCWGLGGLGNGTGNAPQAFSKSAVPVQVQGVGDSGTLGGVKSITAGSASFCALLDSGGVDCWGRSNDGELGSGANSGDGAPTQVVDVGGTGTLTGVSSLTAGQQSFCGLLDSGRIDCWGLGENGQLGDGHVYKTGILGSATPVQVKGIGGVGTLSAVSSVSAASFTYCAIVDSGNVVCWGVGQNGELGNGSFAQSAKPVIATSL